MAEKQLTIRDMSKEDLVEIIEAMIDAMPGMAQHFTDENLAATIVGRKFKEIKRIEKRVDSYQSEFKKARSKKKKHCIAAKAYPVFKRYNSLIDQVADLKKRFPQIFKDKES